MLKKIFMGTALLAVFALAPSGADAKPYKHYKHGRGHAYAYGRRDRVTGTHWDDRNDTPGIARRVRRGRNWTPGIARGPLDSRMTPRTFPRDEGRGLGRRIEAREDRHNDRVRVEGRGVGMGVGGGHGHGHGKH
ncbi:MAG: hypothetical protein QOE33_615 [Acidobacteriota bacterium]|nr:hypothetical protein [Acidobacteriota bacterium]